MDGLRSFANFERSLAVSTASGGFRHDYLRFQAALREVSRVESEDEVCSSFLGTDTESIVLGVGRYFGRGANLNGLSPLSNEIDERADRGGSHLQAFQDFFVFSENIFRVQPYKVFLVRPAVKQIRARNPASKCIGPGNRICPPPRRSCPLRHVIFAS